MTDFDFGPPRSRVGRTQRILGLATFAFAAGLAGCASQILKINNSDHILASKEYEEAIEVQTLPSDVGQQEGDAGAYVLKDAPPYVPPPSAQISAQMAETNVEAAKQQAKSTAKAGAKGKTASVPKATPPPEETAKQNSAPVAVGAATALPIASVEKRQPEIEDSNGFQGRRPVVDPFRVGESVTLEASYFSVVAGDITLEVRPHKVVNGRKAYHFAGTARSTSVFALFYAVEDTMETFVDFDDLIPYNYALHVKESKQLREVRSFFDWKKLRGYVWDRKVTNDKGVKEEKYEWDILPYAQNVFSTPFYIRTFKLEPGKAVHFRIGHEGKNLLLTADVLRREKLSTAIGELNTVVIRPKLEIDGVFKPMGEVYFWLTDDDRKFVVRIEAKIKIGKVVAQVKSINK
ncbi:MAG: DUF3108 domain-containing protein [Bdellovibrionaceae bacterium]|nr:DUF3108 domain-containing protein [Pseudobdellovibrionaceae bacterium]